MEEVNSTDVAASGWWGYLLRTIENALQGDIPAILATVATGLLATGLGWVLKKIYEHHRELAKVRDAHRTELSTLREENAAAVALLKDQYEQSTSAIKAELAGWVERFNSISKSVEGDGLWLSKPTPTALSDLSDSIPILTVANLKGGVGKTTVTANLAAYFASRGKRVLAVDLDFQGSLSGLGNQQPIGESAASMLVRGQLQAGALNLIGDAQGHPKLKIVPAEYDLARSENSMMIRWLIGSEARDVRYLISELLQLPEVQSRFDVILFDNPPRLTTGAVQALAASKHVLIPTVLDKVSADAVIKFIGQLEINRRIWPSLRLAGVLGTMTQNDIGSLQSEPYNGSSFRGAETGAIVALEAGLSALRETTNIHMPENPILPFTTFVADKVEIGRRADSGFAFGGNDAKVNAIFSRLGIEVAKRIGLKLDS